MKKRMLLILTFTLTAFCLALAQAQAQTPTPVSSDPDNVQVQQEGQFGPGSAIDTPGAEPNEVSEKDGLAAETLSSTRQSASAVSLNSAVGGQDQDVNAKIDVQEVLGADLNESQ
jgi:hypothetical protein